MVQWKKQHGNLSHNFSIKSEGNLNFGKILESWELLAYDKTLYGQVDDALIRGLRPVVIYQVRVFAENELGKSKERFFNFQHLFIFCII